MKAKKTLKWLFFSVIISVIPLIGIISLIALTNKIQINIHIFLAKGELILISIVFSAAAIGDFVFSEKEKEIWHNVIGFFCTIILLLSASWFAVISTNIFSKTSYDKNIVSYGSIILFGFTILISFFTIKITED